MTVEIALIALLVFQQVFFMFQVQKLLNKLMSRNYFEYEASKPKTETPSIKVPTDDNLPDDLRVLQGIGLN